MILVTAAFFEGLDKENFPNQNLFSVVVELPDENGVKRRVRLSFDVGMKDWIKGEHPSRAVTVQAGNCDVLFKRKTDEGTALWITMFDEGTNTPTFVEGGGDTLSQVKYRLSWKEKSTGEDRELYLNNREMANTQRIKVRQNGGTKTEIHRGILDRYGAFTPDPNV